MSYQLKLWDSKRERKLTGPNTLPAIRRTKGPSKSRGASRLQTGPARPRRRQGAGGRGKGQARPQDRIPYRTASRPPVSNQRPPEILDGRHPPGGSRGDIGRTHPTSAGGDWGWGRGGQRAHAPDGCRRKLRLGPRRGEGTPHPGRVHPESP